MRILPRSCSWRPRSVHTSQESRCPSACGPRFDRTDPKIGYLVKQWISSKLYPLLNRAEFIALVSNHNPFRGKLQQECGLRWTHSIFNNSNIKCLNITSQRISQKLGSKALLDRNNMLQIFSFCTCKVCSLYCNVLARDLGQWLQSAELEARKG